VVGQGGDIVHATVRHGGLEPMAVGVGSVGEPTVGEEQERGDGHGSAQKRK
jgi:hypothetical protein